MRNRFAQTVIAVLACVAPTTAFALQTLRPPVSIAQVANTVAAAPDVIWSNGNWYVAFRVGSQNMGMGAWLPGLRRVDPTLSMSTPVNVPVLINRQGQVYFRLSVDQARAYYALLARFDSGSPNTLSTGPVDFNAPAYPMQVPIGTTTVTDLGFDCDNGQCLVGTNGVNPGAVQVIHVRSGPANGMSQFTSPQAPMSVLQIGNQGHILYANGNAMPAGALDWNLAGAMNNFWAVFVPTSLVAVRMNGTFLAIMSDGNAGSQTIYRTQFGGAQIPNLQPVFTNVRWSDGDSRGKLAVFCGTQNNGQRSYVMAEHSSLPTELNRFTAIGVPLATPPTEPGPCRIALERGPNHQGRGLLVFERETVPGLQREIFAQALYCHNAVDCDDEVDGTVDSCDLSGAEPICRHVLPMDAGDAAVTDASVVANDGASALRDSGADADAFVDVPVSREASVVDAADVADASVFADQMDPSVDAMPPTDGGGSSDLDSASDADASAALNDSAADTRDPSQQLVPHFNGGACQCRAAGPSLPSKNSASLAFLLISVCAVVAVKRRQ